VRDELVGAGQTWTFTAAYSGTANAGLVQQGSISAANPTDPVPTNNSATSTTHYGP
jgi:hypothetical protein